MHNSAMLCTEIKRTSTGLNDCGVWFWNGSYIICKVAAESSRGARANCLIIDESRMVSKDIIDRILSPMLNAPRTPGYLRKPQYKNCKREIGKKLFLSSAWYQQSMLFDMTKDYTARMIEDDSKFFSVDLPYQLSIKEGLLMRETIENEMAESTFNDISFMMEYEGKFYGSSEDALFNYNVLSDRRILQESLHDLEYYRANNINIPKKQPNEKRILSLDIALLASKRHKNDASCFVINQCYQVSDDNMVSNITYIETKEGLVTEELGLMTMRYFYQYDCDYLSIDANGIGQSVLDYVMADRYDPLYARNYGAIQTVNSDDLNERCKVKNAPKVIYAIKANAKSNNDMALSLRAGFQNGNINLLVSDIEMEDKWTKMIKGYTKLSDIQQARLRAPYAQTSLLIEELINLEHDISNGLIKVKERSGMRKDRYSSIQYNYYVAQELARNLKPRSQSATNLADLLPIRTPKRSSSF